MARTSVMVARTPLLIRVSQLWHSNRIETAAAAGGSAAPPQMASFNYSDWDGRADARIPLRWTVCLSRIGSDTPVTTTTRKLCTDSFSCLTDQEFVIGEVVHCTLLAPAFDLGSCYRRIAFDSYAKVVSVETAFNAAWDVEFNLCTWTMRTREIDVHYPEEACCCVPAPLSGGM